MSTKGRGAVRLDPKDVNEFLKKSEEEQGGEQRVLGSSPPSASAPSLSPLHSTPPRAFSPPTLQSCSSFQVSPPRRSGAESPGTLRRKGSLPSQSNFSSSFSFLSKPSRPLINRSKKPTNFIPTVVEPNSPTISSPISSPPSPNISSPPSIPSSPSSSSSSLPPMFSLLSLPGGTKKEEKINDYELSITLFSLRMFFLLPESKISLKIGAIGGSNKVHWIEEVGGTLGECEGEGGGEKRWRHSFSPILHGRWGAKTLVFAVSKSGVLLGQGFCPLQERTSSVRREIVIHEKENVFTSIGLLIATIKPALRQDDLFDKLKQGILFKGDENSRTGGSSQEERARKGLKYIPVELKKRTDPNWESFPTIEVPVTLAPPPEKLPPHSRYVYQSHLQMFQYELEETEEAKHFRYRMHMLLHDFKQNNIQSEIKSTHILAKITQDPLPKHFAPTLQIYFFLWREGGVGEGGEKVPVNCLLEDSLEGVLRMGLGKGEGDISEFYLKICGTEEHIFDLSLHISSLTHVRRCLCTGESIIFHALKSERGGNGGGKRKEHRRTMRRTPQQDTSLGMEEVKETWIPITSLDQTELQMRVLALEQFETKDLPPELREEKICYFFSLEIKHGPHTLVRPFYSSFVNTLFWSRWISLGIPLSLLPKGTTVVINVYCGVGRVGKVLEGEMWKECGGVELLRELERDGDVVGIGRVRFSLFDFRDRIRRGTTWWPLGGENKAGVLVVEFPAPPHPIGWPTKDRPTSVNQPSSSLSSLSSRPNPPPRTPVGFPQMQDENFMPDVMELENLHELSLRIRSGLVQEATEEEKKLLWSKKEFCAQKFPQLLSLVVGCVDWVDPTSVQKLYEVLNVWERVPVYDALHLLESQFADSRVRHVSVLSLDSLSDEDFVLYLPQLLQVFKYELFCCSPLAELLLLRSVSSLLVGHYFFWHVKAEMEMDVSTQDRFALLLDVFLSACGEHREKLCGQYGMIKKWEGVARAVKTIHPKKRGLTARAMLSNECVFKDAKSIPTDPKISVKGLQVEKCKTMQSETVPLWLTFENKDSCAPNVSFIFKVGDDLRKDILTLQMLRVMDGLWKKVGLDLHLFPYNVVSTGVNTGLIEVVPNSRTLADIHKTYGGVTAAVVKSSSLQNWLKSGATPEVYEKKVQNFILSCAGYSVATYILGIGDRHNDNIMVTDMGNIFHIDFSRVMGDVMKFAGVERETAPFVLTPDFVEVMGGGKSEGFKGFVKLCCRAYNVVREHARLFLSLFSIMCEMGIPRIQQSKDLLYLKTALQLGQTNEEASKHFERLIHQSYDNVRARLNFAVHILANPG